MCVFTTYLLKATSLIVIHAYMCRNSCSFFCSIFLSNMPNKFLEDRITSAIISEEEMSDNASPALYDIRRKIRMASSKVRDKLDQMTKSAHIQKYLRENIVTMRNGRYVVPVKAECKNDVKGLLHDTSASGLLTLLSPHA